MDAGRRAHIVELLGAAFGNATDVSMGPDQPLLVLLGSVELPSPWTPSPTRALTQWSNWPSGRPEFWIDASVVGRSGQPPRSSSAAYLIGENWHTFSFSFPWNGRDDPVGIVQQWLNRFVAEQD